MGNKRTRNKMGKNKGGGGVGGKGDTRSRDKVDHRGGGRGNKRGGGDDDPASEVPQELIEKAAMLGCEVW